MSQAKYLNNIIEQDHRFIKKRTKPMLGFKSFETAMKTIEGIETMKHDQKGAGPRICLSLITFNSSISYSVR